MHGEEHRGHAEQRDKGEREKGRETMSAMGEAAPTTNGLGSVDLDSAPGAESLAESSPDTAAAAAADVEVVSAPNQEGTRERHSGRRSTQGLRDAIVEPKKPRTAFTR